MVLQSCRWRHSCHDLQTCRWRHHRRHRCLTPTSSSRKFHSLSPKIFFSSVRPKSQQTGISWAERERERERERKRNPPILASVYEWRASSEGSKHQISGYSQNQSSPVDHCSVTTSWSNTSQCAKAPLVPWFNGLSGQLLSQISGFDSILRRMLSFEKWFSVYSICAP